MRRLGRLPVDQVALARAPSFGRLAARVPKPVLDRQYIAFQPRLWRNDVLPNCTAVALGNWLLAASALDGFEIGINPARVPEFYASVVGCDPTVEAMARTDGALMVEALGRFSHGFDVGNNTVYGAFGTIGLGRVALANAMDVFAVANIGVDLFERDMQTRMWNSPSSQAGAASGGHDVVLWDYTGLGDDDTVRCATWGEFYHPTWRWIEDRIREAHVMVTRLAADIHGHYWNGMDFDELMGLCRACSPTS